MGLAPRRRAKPRPGPRNWASAGRCGVCGKVGHPSRSAAKKAVRAWHPQEFSAVSVYRCHGSEFFHIGHKRQSAKGAA